MKTLVVECNDELIMEKFNRLVRLPKNKPANAFKVKKNNLILIFEMISEFTIQNQFICILKTTSGFSILTQSNLY